MTVAEVAKLLDGKLLVGNGYASRQVAGGYVSDLLSDVIANAQEGDVWITLQKHLNTIAVAQMKGLAAVVLVNGRLPEPDTLNRAEQEGVPIIGTSLCAFDAAGLLYGCGVRGRRRC